MTYACDIYKNETGLKAYEQDPDYHAHLGDTIPSNHYIEWLEENHTTLLEKVDLLHETLKLAYRHIVKHHAVGHVIEAGQFCKVCCHEDDTEPEMNQIYKVIHDNEKAH